MQIENKIREFILKHLYYSDDCSLGEEDSFLETGVVDSMGVMELVAFVQSEFGIGVAQEEIVVENFDSIRKLADFVSFERACCPFLAFEVTPEPDFGTITLTVRGRATATDFLNNAIRQLKASIAARKG